MDYRHEVELPEARALMRDASVGGGPTRSGVKSYLDRLIREKAQQTGVAGTYILGPDHDARRSLYIVGVHNRVQTFLKTLEVD